MKKKTTLFATGVFASAVAFAQFAAYPAGSFTPAAVSPAHQAAQLFASPLDVFAGNNSQQPAQNVQPAVPLSTTETIIGNTTYSLQTNNSVHRQIMAHSDGTISAMWTFSSGSFFSWPDRGSGYNYFNGTSWGAQPTTRLENVRTGFGDIIVTGAGAELTVAHNTANNSQHFMTRPAKGTGTWTNNTSLLTFPAGHPGSLWPVTAVGGANNDVIHHLALATPSSVAGGGPWRGQDGALQYSRSNDGGQTFAVQNSLIAAFDSTQEVGYSADAYTIDSRGDYVAVVAGGIGRDVVLAKSADGGVTWAKTVIEDFPIPLFNDQLTDPNNDGIIDTLTTNDGSLSVLIDNNNMVHVWFGNMRMLNDDSTDGSYSYFPGTNGLIYWNENMGSGNAVTLTGALDLDNNGTLDIPVDFGTYQKSLSSFPSSCIDNNGTIYLAYSALVENSADLVTAFCIRNIYMMASTDGGATWTAPYNISPDLTLEKVYPNLARSVVNGQINLVYERDDVAGHGVGTNNPPDPENANTIHEIIHAKLPATDVFVGITEQLSAPASFVAFPNPSDAETWISTNVHITTGTLEIYSAAGQLVSTSPLNQLAAGTQLALGTSTLAPGAYLIRVINGQTSSTRHLIIQ
ncbi:MAG: T9SS type A sorting domain-containing protein [Bacteroidetes bacterium]|nr:T9SS type A sorting domain-containing protein [Bacteroidota bacterium]